jgi:hypothetical protein
MKYYARYMDDFVIVHRDKKYYVPYSVRLKITYTKNSS